MLSKNNLVLYEIYPRSFKDSDGNGYGDIAGIISQLDYLKDFGINAIWITPFYPSPMKDGGYDIKDYCDVSSEFGSMEDFRRLITQAHNRDIQVVIDLVVNHTSDQHPWFIESRSSRDNPKRDWYIWKDPVDGHEPNNWMSVFEPKAWTFDEKTGQYYMHSFLKEQPDLNWAHPEVMEAIKGVMKFWLDEGVDGFRLDAANYMWKDQRFLDEPKDPSYQEGKIQPFYQLKHIYMRDQEQLFEIIDALGQFVAQQGNGFIISESYLNKQGIDAIVVYKQYYESIASSNVIPFNFELIRIPWNAPVYREFISTYLHALTPEELPSFVLGNHDKPRLATRIGSEQAKVAAVLLLTLPGMPVIYYGEELGMQDVRIPREMIQDTKEFTSPGFGRDPVRTPMQWDDTQNAGFTSGTPWLPLEDAWKIKNVAVESNDPHSMFNLYKTLLQMRSQDKAFIEGEYQEWESGNEHVFSYFRSHPQSTKAILLNFSDQEQVCKVPFEEAKMLLTTAKELRGISNAVLTLQPNEACILEGVGLNSR